MVERVKADREAHPLPLRRAWEAIEWGLDWREMMLRPLPVFPVEGDREA